MNEVCPGCGRHCALNEVRCDRGRAYVQTGVLPERNAHGEGGRDGHEGHGGHEGHEGHGGHGGRRHAGQGAEYHDLPLESKLAVSVRELAHAFRRQEEQEAFPREVFGCLTEEEKNALLTSLEKVCRGLHHRD